MLGPLGSGQQVLLRVVLVSLNCPRGCAAAPRLLDRCVRARFAAPRGADGRRWHSCTALELPRHGLWGALMRTTEEGRGCGNQNLECRPHDDSDLKMLAKAFWSSHPVGSCFGQCATKGDDKRSSKGVASVARDNFAINSFSRKQEKQIQKKR